MAERPMPELEGVSHEFAEVNGVRLHYALAGRPSGEPVVLVHGWPQHWYAWRRVIPLLAGRFRVVAPDLRGFGWSEAPRSSYEKRELGHDIAELLRVLDLRGVRLAGHDWGGAAVFHAALEVPDRIRSLTALAIAHPWAKGTPPPLGIVAAALYQPPIATPLVGVAVQRFTPLVKLVMRLSGPGVWSGEERNTFASQFAEPARAEAASRLYRSFLMKELRQRGPETRLQVPARLILGDKDPVATEGLNAGAAEAGIDVEVIRGGHWLPETAPDAVAERMAA